MESQRLRLASDGGRAGVAREGAHVAAKYSSVSPGGAHPPPRAPCPPPPAGWTPPPPCASGPVTPPRPRVAGSFFTTRTASRRAFAAGPASAGCVRLDRPRPTPRALDLRLGSRVPQTRRRRHRAPFDSRATAPDLAPPESDGQRSRMALTVGRVGHESMIRPSKYELLLMKFRHVAHTPRDLALGHLNQSEARRRGSGAPGDAFEHEVHPLRPRVL